MAAGDNLVNITFAAEDEASATFAKVQSELAAVQSKAAQSNAAWRAETGLSAQATIGANKPMAELRAHAGKTAADFKPATQAMRDASVAVEDLGKKGTSGMGEFRGSMRALRMDIFEVVALLGVMVKAVDEAGKAEAAQRHARDQGISNVSIIKLEGAARQENFDPAEYDNAAVSLKVAGVAAKNLDTDVTQLGIASRVSGVPLKELIATAASMTEEFASGGVPTMTQMNTLTLASSGATQGLTDEYRELAKTLKYTEEEWKVQEQAQARSHKKMEEQTSAIDSFAGKTGIAAQAFKAFSHGGGSISGAGIGMAGGVLSKQFSEGLAQLSNETGIGTQQIKNYMTAGKIGYEDLISASGRYKAHQQEEIEFTQKQRDEKLRLDTEAKQRALGLEALKSVMSESDWKDHAADLQKLTPEGVEQQMQAQVTNAMVQLGQAIVKWFPEIKVAMMFLAGVEIASRIAAVNARFAPGLFKPSPAPGTSSATGDVVRDATNGVGGAGKVGGLASTVGAQIDLITSLDPNEHLKTYSQLMDDRKKNAPEVAKQWKAVGDWWNTLTGQGQKSAPDKVAALGNQPTSAAQAPGSKGPSEVSDPKMQELVGQLLQVFTGG
jgi:hypothetical protein